MGDTINCPNRLVLQKLLTLVNNCHLARYTFIFSHLTLVNAVSPLKIRLLRAGAVSVIERLERSLPFKKN